MITKLQTNNMTEKAKSKNRLLNAKRILGKSKNKPEVKIDKVLLETLCGYQAPLAEIAHILKTTQIAIKTFVKKEYKTDWKQFYAEKSAIGKSKLRENQFNLAKKSPEMAKYLDGKYLREKENEGITEVASKINPKRKKFADKLLEGADQTEAAKFAGYSTKTAKVIASQLVRDQWVAEYLRLRRLEEESRSMITKEKYLDILNTIAMDSIMPTDKIGAIKVIGKWMSYEAPVIIKADITLKDVLGVQEQEEQIEL
jgi:hypothetical protein